MEALDKLVMREQQRYDPNILDPVVVNNINDIKRIVSELDPAKNKQSRDIPLSINAEVDGKLYNVTTNTRSKSKREILLEGFDIIKKRLELNQQDVPEIQINNRIVKCDLLGSMDCQSWIDPLIKQWLGGRRDGLYILWDLNNSTYKYDIYNHKLTRIVNEIGPTTTSTV